MWSRVLGSEVRVPESRVLILDYVVLNQSHPGRAIFTLIKIIVSGIKEPIIKQTKKIRQSEKSPKVLYKK